MLPPINTSDTIKNSIIQSFRKSLIVWTIVAWLVMIADVCYGLTSSFSAIALVSRLGQILYIIVIPFWSAHAWRSQIVTDLQLALLIFVACVATTLSALVTERGRLMTMNIAIFMITMLLMNPKFPVLQCLLFVPSYMIAAYNMTFGVHGYPGAIIIASETSLIADIAAHVRTIAILAILLFAVHKQTIAYMQTLAKTQSTVNMTKVVTEDLKFYKTDNAKIALEMFRNDHVDGEVFMLLESLIENLNEYRPFIPHYLLRGEGGKDDSNKSVSSSTLTSLDDSEGEDNGNTGGSLSDTVEPQDESPSVMTTTVNVIAPPSTPLKGFFAVNRVVSYALLNFSPTSIDVIEDPRTLKHFVDVTFRAVGKFDGVVHSFLADTVNATWNGVELCGRCQRRSSECVRYMSGHLSPKISLTGAVMTGEAVCKMTGTQHQAFLMHIDWNDALHTLLHAGRRIKTIALCQDTVRDFAVGRVMHIDTVVGHMNYKATELVKVYEFANSMFQYEHYSEGISEAIRNALEGDFESALLSIQSLMSKEKNNLQLNSVIALRKKITLCLEKNSSGSEFPVEQCCGMLGMVGSS